MGMASLGVPDCRSLIRSRRQSGRTSGRRAALEVVAMEFKDLSEC